MQADTPTETQLNPARKPPSGTPTKPDAKAAASSRWSWGKVLRPLAWMLPMALVAGVFAVMAVQKWSASQEPVKIPPKPQARQSVRVATAAKSEIQAWVFGEGTARSVRREYLTFEMTGRVTMVGPKKEGELVKKGQVLAELDQRKYQADVDAAIASVEEAKTKAQASAADAGQAQTQYELTLSQFNRIKGLYQRKASTKAEFEESQAKLDNARAAVDAAKAQSQAVLSQIEVNAAKLQQAKVALEGALIKSPIDGIVAYLNIEEGYYYAQSNVKTNSEEEALQTIPMVVIDPSEYELTLDIPSFDAERIQVGQQVLLLPGGTSEAATMTALNGPLDNSPASAPDWEARGVVYSVNPAVNPGGRSIQVKVRTIGGAEKVKKIRDGMFATCWIATEVKTDAVVAPFDALLYEENRPFVFVYQPKTQTVQRREVTLGIQGFTHREILKGVNEGEQLVTDGRYRLVDGAPVRVLEDEQTPGGKSSKVHRLDQVLQAINRSESLQHTEPLDPRMAKSPLGPRSQELDISTDTGDSGDF